MKIARLILGGAVLLTCAQFSFAQVFRCDAGNGKVTYSDKLCADGAKERLVDRKRTAQEIREDELRAQLANERKYRAQAMEQRDAAIRQQQQAAARPVQTVAAPPLASSRECKEAQKDYDFAASIRTGSDTDRRIRTNAAITKVNASCGSNTPLQQEPPKVIIRNANPGGPVNCDQNWCTDSSGNVSPRMR